MTRKRIPGKYSIDKNWAVVARRRGDGWEGCRIKVDFRPSTYGPKLWYILHTQLASLPNYLKLMIDVSRDRVNEKTTDPIEISWVYVFDEPTRIMSIFVPDVLIGESERSPRSGIPPYPRVRWYWDFKLVANIRLDGQEPDWEEIEIRAARL